MNVNPFSYLMNKISQKVSKSGDRMTGELEFYNLGDSIHINRAGNATYSGWLKFSNANGLCGMYGAHNNKKPYFYDGNDFTQIALISDLDKGSVSVTADGVKTYRQLFNELQSLVDFSKVSANTKLSINTSYFVVTYNGGSNILFSQTDISSQLPSITRINISTNSSMTSYQNNSWSDGSTNVPESGAKISIFY